MTGAFLALAALVVQQDPIPDRLPPVERCVGDNSFVEFRSGLNAIVARKDEGALLKTLSDDAEVNFGGDRGPKDFAAAWKFDEPGESYVWAELKDALTMGCAPSGDALVAPSFVAQFPAQLDAFETVIVLPGTRLRSAASDRAPQLADLDWHLAKTTDGPNDEWLRVQLIDGPIGFVRRNQTVNPLDYRLVFEKRRGRWMITAFVAGD